MEELTAPKVKKEQWLSILTEIEKYMFKGTYLEDKEYQQATNDIEYIRSNIDTHSRMFNRDYYKLNELRAKFLSPNNSIIKYKFVPEAVEIIHNLVSDLKGKKRKPDTPQQVIDEQIENLSKETRDNINLLNSQLVVIQDKLENEINDLKNTDFQSKNLEIKKILKEIRSSEKTIKEVVGVVAENANAGRYLQYAQKNRSSARWLFWVSIMGMLVISIIICQHMWNLDTIEVSKLWSRIPLLFAILLPFFFMMRESKKLKDKEFQFKDMECRILTAGQFIDSLEITKEKKDQLKADLVKDFFSRPIECRDDGGIPPIENICEIIKACIERK